jgi:hypothetical protein
MSCPSRFELELVEAGLQTQGEETRRHADACARCTAVLDGLRAARVELLGAQPAATAQLAVRRLLAEAEQRRTARRRFRFWLPVGLAPVFAGLALLVVTGDLSRRPDQLAGAGPTNSPSAGGVRTKGTFVLDVVAKRGDVIYPIGDGAEARPGDRLRFAYTLPTEGHLLLFSIDDRGRVSPYYRDDRLASIDVRAGAGVLLPGSIELDDHHGWERIFAIVSPRPLDPEVVRKAVESGLADVGGDVTKLQRLPLAGQGDQTSLLLKRP